VADNVHHILVSSPLLLASLRKDVFGKRFGEGMANHSILCGNPTLKYTFSLNGYSLIER